MGQVIQLNSFATHPTKLHAVRQAVNARARELHVPDEQRRHAVGIAFEAMREGRSSALAICLGWQDLRPTRAAAAPYTGPEAA